jgi:hypothetical protein
MSVIIHAHAMATASMAKRCLPTICGSQGSDHPAYFLAAYFCLDHYNRVAVEDFTQKTWFNRDETVTRKSCTAPSRGPVTSPIAISVAAPFMDRDFMLDAGWKSRRRRSCAHARLGTLGPG